MTDIDLKFLDEERKKAWQRLEEAESKISLLSKIVEEAKQLAESKISTDEASAKTAALSATSYSQTAETKSNEIISILSEITPVIEEFKQNKQLLTSAIKKATEIDDKYMSLSEITSEITKEQSSIQTLQSQTSASLSNVQTLETQITSTSENTIETYNKINDLYSKSSTLKSQISDLHNEILGYENDDGEPEEGLKDELEKSYKVLKENLNTLSSDFVILKDDKTKEFDGVIADATKKHNQIVSEIKSHLPGGVAAGLAGAFNEKKTTETESMLKAYKGFKGIIWTIFGVASITVILYLAWILTGKPIDEAIKAIPNTTLLCLPLYAPLIWIAIHLNKKINLSKKLIEEYAYKETISKSVTGMSEQIKNLKDEDISQEIYTNLLRLIISASSDNPGKYITEYNKCDNPLVEILSDPQKFSKLIDSTPGMRDAMLSVLKLKAS